MGKTHSGKKLTTPFRHINFEILVTESSTHIKQETGYAYLELR